MLSTILAIRGTRPSNSWKSLRHRLLVRLLLYTPATEDALRRTLNRIPYACSARKLIYRNGIGTQEAPDENCGKTKIKPGSSALVRETDHIN
jgi:hypothetical protein